MTSPDISARHLRVLLVDDNPDNREIYAQHLRFTGHEVIEASDASDGLFKAIHGHPDVIVMDLWMPGLDGLSAIRTLRAHPKTATIPVVAISADVLTDSPGAALSAGADEFCPKPFGPADLTAVVERLAKTLVSSPHPGTISEAPRPCRRRPGI